VLESSGRNQQSTKDMDLLFRFFPLCLLASNSSLSKKMSMDFMPTQHISALASRPFQHRRMYGMWRKTHFPRQNKQRKTTQPKKANALSPILVLPCKPPNPHKEKETPMRRIFFCGAGRP
jgi:hypothetical protein